MSVIIFKRIIEMDTLGRCQYGNIKHCGIVDASYKNWKRVEKLVWWLNDFLFFIEKLALKFSHKIYEGGIMSKICQSNRLNIVELTNIFIHTHLYIVFHKKMSVIIFKRIIEKDPMARCQYRNIKHYRVVNVFYKDWKESGKAWLMVRWFLIFHGKTSFEISS